MTGSGLDSIGASQQTRDHLRDAYIRMGACMFIVMWPGLAIVNSAFKFGLHFSIVFLAAIVSGIAVGYLGFRSGKRNEARRLEREQAERKARKQGELDAFLAANSEDK